MNALYKTMIQSFLPEKVLVHAQALDHYLNGEREIRLLPNLCDRQRSSLDIGANIGTYTYFLRKYSTHVYAYEPNPILCDRLRRVFPDVYVRHAAVSDSSGELILYVPVEKGRAQHELASVAQRFETSTKVERYTVPSIRIDDEYFVDVGFIKIDVEQYEIPVLKGSLDTIKRCRPIVMSEVTPILYPHPLPEMFTFLTSLGYDAWFRFDGRWRSLKEFRPKIHANRKQWGKKFMDNNIIFIPMETDCSFLDR